MCVCVCAVIRSKREEEGRRIQRSGVGAAPYQCHVTPQNSSSRREQDAAAYQCHVAPKNSSSISVQLSRDECVRRRRPRRRRQGGEGAAA